ncbi:hypothetical protein BDL97_01G175000 [Sphagnum fallax]|nr:hypothetical protein BDL97_01G175000 [Sphagnum fallax]
MLLRIYQLLKQVILTSRGEEEKKKKKKKQNKEDMSINGTLTAGIVGVWNVSQYPCKDFRNETVKWFFVLWPEMLNGVFNYCCEDGVSTYSLANFTYGLHQGQLDPRPYFDLGVVDTFPTYWYFWTFWQVPTKSISFPLHCDYTDLHRLYVSRFWNKTIVLGAKTGAVLVGILQLAVLVWVLCLWVGPFFRPHHWISESRRSERLSPRWRQKMLKDWFWRLEYADLITDWAHLILLALVGACMMEAIGHSSLHMWRASVMYNAGAVYSYLTAMAILSSLVRQSAMCILPRQSVDGVPVPRHSRSRLMPFDSIDTLPVAKDSGSRLMPCESVDNTPWGRSRRAWKGLRDVTDDWRWQKVFAQLGVLILMGTYLALVDTDDGGAMDNVAGIVLAAVVAACIWSAGVTFVVFFRSATFMILAWKFVRPHILDEYLDEKTDGVHPNGSAV